MKAIISKFILTALLIVPVGANAYVDFGAFYLSDSFKTDDTTSSSNMFIEGSVGLSIDSKKRYMIGWNYSMFSVSSKTMANTKYSSTQMGPRFIWRIGRERAWSLGVGYNLIANAKYDDGSGSSVTWKGSGLKFDFGYSFTLSEEFMLGIRGNYASASYNEQLTASDDYSKVSYTRSHMYPSISMLWVW